MREKKFRKTSILIVSACCILKCSERERDTLEMAKELWTCGARPSVYPQPIPGDMDLGTLSALLDSGNLQWYLPRPEEDQWDVMAAMKIHAPRDLVWQVLTDYKCYTEYMPDTLLEYIPISRKGNIVNHRFKAKTSVINFAYHYDIYDLLTEKPPNHLHSDTYDGGFKGRQVDWYLVPIDDNQNTLIFIRYYPCLKSLGLSMRAVLTVLPMIEWPVTASACNYILRGYRDKAEKLVGYDRPESPGPLNYDALDVDTLRYLSRFNPGLIRETKDAKNINGLNYTFIDAPPEVVWKTITDFDRFNEFRMGGYQIIKKEGSQVRLNEHSPKLSILIFDFGGMEMETLYTLDPPYHISFKTVKGLYEGSAGDYHIMPVDNSKGSILFNTVGLNTEKDDSLTMRMVKSGAFPFETMMSITACTANLAEMKVEAEKREVEK